jgi:hypothetical protein
MSVRAYRITTLEHENSETFNLWHDEELMSLLSYCMDTLDESGGGIIEFRLEELQEALPEAKQERTKSILKKMIGEAQKTGWVRYVCF